ncbi:MAG: ABC transporter ATP-binding protein/permease [Firmicutes bacterium]|nr:ABC transporter ATP-binding protein/permease [Bacillota bacterium]
MIKRTVYLKYIPLTVFILLIFAFINFKLAFALYDMINRALEGDWVGFFDNAKVVMIFALLMLPTNLLIVYFKGTAVKKIMIEMKEGYIKSVFQKNISEFQQDNNALYISALTNDFNTIEKDYVEQIFEVIEAFIAFTTSILIITLISPVIFLIGVAMVLLNAIISIFATKPIKKHHKERSEMMSSYGGFIKEILSAFNIIKTNNLESKVIASYNLESKKIQDKKYVIDRIMSYIYAIQNVNSGVLFMGLMLAVCFLTIKGVILFSGVVVIVTNIDNITKPIAQFSEAIPRMISVKALFNRIEDTLVNHYVYEENTSFNGLQDSIEFRGVSFSYGDKLILDTINLKFEKGKKYLIIGPSGGGKSTLLRLLRKYFPPQAGKILVDGIELQDIMKFDYFSKISNIEQQIFLFEDTFKNNMTLYKEYSNEELCDAINRAGLNEFVEEHTDGINRLILDNGKNISGGEKSRIAIARGLLIKANIIFLDEAFASLDRQRAMDIENSLFALNGVTVINVSHVIIEENKNKYDKIIMVNKKKCIIVE